MWTNYTCTMCINFHQDMFMIQVTNFQKGKVIWNQTKYWNPPFPCPPTYFWLHNKYRLWSGWGIYEWFIANTPRCSRSAPIASIHPPFSQSFPWAGKPPTINKSVDFFAVVCRLLFGVRLMCAKFKARWFAGVADKLFTKFSTSPRKPFRSWA